MAGTFDQSEEYDDHLRRGIRLSGEDKFFFIRGRVRDMMGRLPREFRPDDILDFGCGLGETARYLSEQFPGSQVTGTDLSESALDHSRKRHAGERVRILPPDRLDPCDLCYANGVFHHVEPAGRLAMMKRIHSLLKRGGYFALFENNPWNPGTRMVMKRIPFDRDAQPLSVLSSRRLLRDAGFAKISRARFLFYFPRGLSVFRPLERYLAALPFGAQYYYIAQKE